LRGVTAFVYLQSLMEQNEINNAQFTEFAHGIPAQNALQELFTAWQEGHINALEGYIAFHRLEQIAADFKTLLKDNALTEASKWAERSFKYMGVTVEKKAGAGRWDFKGVQAWNEAKANLTSIEERAKMAFKMKQSFNSESVTEDGEVIEGATYSAGKDIIAIKL
jgi:hypothetical protein